MIVTVTLNPSVDRTIEVDTLTRGAVLRARATRVDPGGKGINVSRALVANGHDSRAVLPCGGAEGRQLTELLAEAGVDVVVVPIRGAVRANVSVVEPGGTVTKLNEPGPVLTGEELDGVVTATVRAARDAAWVVLSGSLPRGAVGDTYARFVARLADLPLRVAVDSSGPALLAALEAKPDLVKPNREELTEAVGYPIDTLGEAALAAGLLRDRGARAVLASLGPDGAILADETGVHYGTAPVQQRISTVGAGDAMLAGFLAAGGSGAAALAEALAYGAAAIGLPGSRMPSPSDLDRSAVTVSDRFDPRRALRRA